MSIGRNISIDTQTTNEINVYIREFYVLVYLNSQCCHAQHKIVDISTPKICLETNDCNTRDLLWYLFN